MERNPLSAQNLSDAAAPAQSAYEETLGVPATETRHIAYGQGSRWDLPEGPLEHFPERGVVQLTNLRQGVQITFVGQEQPPSMTPDGLVFEQPGADRWLHVGKDGSATVFVGSSAASAAPAAEAPSSTDRLLPSPARPSIQADAASARQPESKEQTRGRVEGNIVYPPEFVVSSLKQKELVRFTVAEHYTDADGQPQTVYHKCVAFNSDRKRLADQVRDQAQTGDSIVVHGNWHDVTVEFRNGTRKNERQLWAYGLKITPQSARTS
jgi:hypothetical protein